MSIELQPVENSEEKIAIVQGQVFSALPVDLYIPPDALEVILETFSGPLDLLLYLIKKQNLDILDIPIAEITRQYMSYIDLMKDLRLELAAEYLVMAAVLAEIKSKMLLPRPQESSEEDDPRADLVRRLQEYERFKQAAENIDNLQRVERDNLVVTLTSENIPRVKPEPNIELKELLLAFQEVMNRAKLYTHHHVKREALSIRDRMVHILNTIQSSHFTRFEALFNVKEGRMGVVVTFIAILELLKQSTIEIVQTDPYAPLHVKAIG